MLRAFFAWLRGRRADRQWERASYQQRVLAAHINNTPSGSGRFAR